MAEIDVPISSRLEAEIDQLVEQGDFLNRQEAVTELLQAGIQTYQTDTSFEDDGDLAFADEMRNPGDEPMGPGNEDAEDDDYTF